MSKRRESKKKSARMKYSTIHNSVHFSTLLKVLCAGLTAISLLFGLMRPTVRAQELETQFWVSETRWALAVFLELDEAAQSAAMDVVDAINSQTGNALSVDENSRAIIAFRNRSNGRFGNPENIIFDGEIYGPSILLLVQDEESPLCVSLLALPIITLEVDGKTEVKIKNGTSTSVKFRRKAVTSIGVISVQGNWVRSEPETTPEDGMQGHFGGDTYYRHFANLPGTLRLLRFRRTAYDIVDVLPTDPSNRIDLEVNFTHPDYDYQTIFGGPIVRALEYFGELQIDTITSVTSCEQ